MSLLALPLTFRFAVFNGTSGAISNAPIGLPTINGVRVRYDSSGAPVFDSNVTFFSTAQASIGAFSYVIGSAFSNTTNAFLGGDFFFSAFASGGLSGPIYAFLEFSPDGTNWPTPASQNGQGGGLIVATLGFASSTTASTASTTRVQYFTL